MSDKKTGEYTLKDNLTYLGLMQRAQKLAIGIEAVTDANRQHKIRLIITSEDASERTKRQAQMFAQESKRQTIEMKCTKADLGGAFGRSEVAIVAILDKGFAQEMARRLIQTGAVNGNNSEVSKWQQQ